MTTTLVGTFVPDPFTNHVILQTMEKAPIFSSGAVVTAQGGLGTWLDQGGRTVEVPAWNEDKTDANLSDDSGTSVTPVAITDQEEAAIRNIWNQHWATKDVVRSMTASDPLDAAADNIARYWAREYDKWITAAFKGMILENQATDGADMIHDSAADNLMSVADFEDTKHTAGENYDMFDGGVALMRSTTYNRLKKDQLVTALRDIDGNLQFETVSNMRIVVTDRMPTITGVDFGSGLGTYNTVALLAPGAMLYDESTTGIVGSAVDRDELTGNGGGEEWISSRRQFMFHPRGWRVDTAGVAGKIGPTLTELALAAMWARIVPERAQSPFAFCVINQA